MQNKKQCLPRQHIVCQNGQMEDIKLIYDRWRKKIMSNREFIEAMYPYHRVLFQYSEHLRGNIIESLYISEHGVKVITRNGVRFACNPEDVTATPLGAFSFGDLEQTIYSLCERLMPERGVFFDIGANVGWYSLHIGRSYPAAQVYAFEPVPAIYGWLKDNISLNGLTNITAFNNGCGEKDENVLFYFRPDMTGATSMRNITASPDAVECTGRVRRLDDCWREIGRNPDMIKCDVEGAELFVFRGGRVCLTEAKPIILCEMLRKWSSAFNYTPNEIIKFLDELGYACFEATESGLKVFERMTDEVQETNFFFFHREKHDKILKDCMYGASPLHSH